MNQKLNQLILYLGKQIIEGIMPRTSVNCHNQTSRTTFFHIWMSNRASNTYVKKRKEKNSIRIACREV